MNYIRTCVIVTAFSLVFPVFPADAEIDRERMRQDLDIMEGILQNLHAQNTTRFAGIHRGPQVRGLHFDNYGVIFLIEEERGPGESGLEYRMRKLEESWVEFEEKDYQKDIAERRKKRRVALRNRLVDFLGTYADGIRQLDDKEKITVMVHHMPDRGVMYGVEREIPGEVMYMGAVRNKQPHSGLSEPVYLEVTSKKRDIVAYRREKINDVEFRKRIDFRDHRPDASTMKKIGVMATILDKALKQTEHNVRRSDGTLGIYQKGLGAIFFVNVRRAYRGTAIHVKRKNDPKAVTYQVRPGKAVEIGNKPKDRLKKELVEIVGDYGYTLRTLKPEEYIVVEVRFPTRLGRRSSDPHGLVLMVKKGDVDAYSGGDLDLAAFREKVDIREY
ncbi:MAG: hypothetical protein OXR72_00155 [Gemmatimonadota bacterium]|nr:hypothetical protein [Gemmatimonadota bacterium]